MVMLLDDNAQDQDPVILPYEYTPRFYQKPIWQAMFPASDAIEAVRRAVLVWHRRAGKDKTTINLVVAKAMERVGTYLYLLPKQTQARKVIWRGMDKEGFKFIDHIPADLIAKKNNTDMYVELVNGSIIQVGGSDTYDAWMGTNPVGIIFSEYSLQDPYAWEYFRPILAENDGWALFIYTPRGHNHGYTLWRNAMRLAKREGSGWFAQLLDTNQTGAISPERIQEDIDSGMSQEMAEQEYGVSFDAFNFGAVYGRQMKKAWKEGRIGFFPAEPGFPVHTSQDIGLGDLNAIWFFQILGEEVRIVHYYQNYNEPMGHYIDYMREWCKEHDAPLGDCYVPHDMKVREYSSNRRRLDIALQDHGMDYQLVPDIPKEDGIEAVRVLLPRCRFNEEETSHGLACLEEYGYEYDDKQKTFKRTPAHNWASHGADAFRYLAVIIKEKLVAARSGGYSQTAKALAAGEQWSPFD
jgi:hypothetical protein